MAEVKIGDGSRGKCVENRGGLSKAVSFVLPVVDGVCGKMET
jgi:hypothetical protein